jgi:diaminohydroxyphosphoribosylaminopyrimidine deaminase/5-amino-6-(5-phosphoribosylamino)uracil reductase
MKILSDKKIDSILIEGGSEIHYSVLESKIANHIYCYIAPKLFGGRNAKSPIGGQGIDSPENCFELTNTNIKQIGSDFLIEADIKNTI